MSAATIFASTVIGSPVTRACPRAPDRTVASPVPTERAVSQPCSFQAGPLAGGLNWRCDAIARDHGGFLRDGKAPWAEQRRDSRHHPRPLPPPPAVLNPPG